MKLKVTVNNIVYTVEVEAEEEQRSLSTMFFGSAAPAAAPVAPAPQAAVPAGGIVAPLAGSVTKVLVEEGQAVASGDVLVVLEAMKMETEITAPADGTVKKIHVTPGDAVQGGQVLVEVE